MRTAFRRFRIVFDVVLLLAVAGMVFVIARPDARKPTLSRFDDAVRTVARVEKRSASLDSASADPMMTTSVRGDRAKTMSDLESQLNEASKRSGTMTVAYEDMEAGSDLTEKDKEMIRDAAIVERAAENVTRTIRLKRDLPITVNESKEFSPYYSPGEGVIIVPWSWFSATYDVRAEAEDSADTAFANMASSVRFILYHEIGHALIDQLDLPTTGDEEDNADQFATLIDIDDREAEGDGALMTGYLFVELRKKESPSAINYFDTHELDEKRLAKALCWVYGFNETEALANLMVQIGGETAQERIPQCPSEYADLRRSWNQLLKPHIVTALASDAANKDEN